jgi:hypothetical protein
MCKTSDNVGFTGFVAIPVYHFSLGFALLFVTFFAVFTAFPFPFPKP